MQIINKEKCLEDGDILTLEGKKYHMKYYDGKPCGFCALNGYLCQKYFCTDEYNCSIFCVYAISAEDAINREKEKIRISQELIKKLTT